MTDLSFSLLEDRNGRRLQMRSECFPGTVAPVRNTESTRCCRADKCVPYPLPTLIDRSRTVQKSRPPLDFGPVNVGIELSLIDEHSSANLDTREFSSKHQIAKRPIGDPQIGCGIPFRGRGVITLGVGHAAPPAGVA